MTVPPLRRRVKRNFQISPEASPAVRFYVRVLRPASLIKRVHMKFHLSLGITLFLLAGASSYAAENGAALFKSKCAVCHGASGEGKPAMKAPAIKGTTLDTNRLTDHLMKGEATSKPPHNKGISGLTADQAKAIAAYVKTL